VSYPPRLGHSISQLWTANPIKVFQIEKEDALPSSLTNEILPYVSKDCCLQEQKYSGSNWLRRPGSTCLLGWLSRHSDPFCNDYVRPLYQVFGEHVLGSAKFGGQIWDLHRRDFFELSSSVSEHFPESWAYWNWVRHAAFMVDVPLIIVCRPCCSMMRTRQPGVR